MNQVALHGNKPDRPTAALGSLLARGLFIAGDRTFVTTWAAVMD